MSSWCDCISLCVYRIVYFAPCSAPVGRVSTLAPSQRTKWSVWCLTVSASQASLCRNWDFVLQSASLYLASRLCRWGFSESAFHWMIYCSVTSLLLCVPAGWWCSECWRWSWAGRLWELTWPPLWWVASLPAPSQPSALAGCFTPNINLCERACNQFPSRLTVVINCFNYTHAALEKCILARAGGRDDYTTLRMCWCSYICICTVLLQKDCQSETHVDVFMEMLIQDWAAICCICILSSKRLYVSSNSCTFQLIKGPFSLSCFHQISS